MISTSTDCSSSEAVENLLAICFPDARTIADATYGNGSFWRGSTRRVWGGDMDPARARSFVADYERLPFADNAVDVVVFDPPFQPQTKNGTGIIGARYTKVTDDDGGFGIGAVDALKRSVQLGLLEADRVGRLGCIVKVQDYIHSRRPVWMSMWLWEVLGEPYDFMTVRVGHKLIAPSWKNQLSIRRNHSTYWVWRTGNKNNYHILRSAVA